MRIIRFTIRVSFQLEPRKGEKFMMGKRWSGKKGETPQWDVWRPGPGETPRAGAAKGGAHVSAPNLLTAARL